MIRLKNKNTNEVKEFKNANQASIDLKIPRGHISRLLNGKLKSAKGWILIDNVTNNNVTKDNVTNTDVTNTNVTNINVTKDNVTNADLLNQIEELKQENERLKNKLNNLSNEYGEYRVKALELKAKYLLLKDKEKPDLLNQIKKLKQENEAHLNKIENLKTELNKTLTENEQLKKEKEKIQTALDIELGWQDRNNTNELESKTNIVEEEKPKADNPVNTDTINTDNTVNAVQNEAVNQKYIHDSTIDEFDNFEEEEETQNNTIVANKEEEPNEEKKEKDDITQTLLSKLGKREDKEETPKPKTVYKGNNDFSDFESDKDLDFWQFSGNFPNLRW